MLTLQQITDRVRDVVRLQQKAWRTEQCYVGWIVRYYHFAKTLPRDMAHERKMEAFLTMLAREREVSATTQSQAFNAIKFLYEDVLKFPLGDISALRAKRKVHARHCPSREEVLALLKHIESSVESPMRLIAAMLYGTGMRVNEALDVRLKDVRLSDRTIVVREPKHGHDRWVRIPELLMQPVKRQMEHARQVFEADQLRNMPLQIPGALSRKYPRSPFTLGWMFLFPSPRPLKEPRTFRMVRWHMPDWLVQRACKDASEAAGLIANVTPHCLRHGFGTHFDGDIRDLQELLGHKSLETTMVYRHPEIDRAVSPLDTLMSA
jgi:integron integrase